MIIIMMQTGELALQEGRKDLVDKFNTGLQKELNGQIYSIVNE
jgi:hypothetical protein